MRQRNTTDKPIPPFNGVGNREIYYPIPVSCDCCQKCWLDPKTNTCMHGGPFSGYMDKDGKTLTSDG